MTSPTTRPAGADDVEVLARIWHDGWVDGHLGHTPDALLAHRTRDSFVPRTRERIPATWVAEVDGAVVGFVVVVGDEVEQVYVDATARGTGVAALLLRRAEQLVRDGGHRTAWLAVATGNERARRFYARQGWTEGASFAYPAETDSGPIEVPCLRYDLDLALARSRSADGER